MRNLPLKTNIDLENRWFVEKNRLCGCHLGGTPVPNSVRVGQFEEQPFVTLGWSLDPIDLGYLKRYHMNDPPTPWFCRTEFIFSRIWRCTCTTPHVLPYP